MKKHFLFIALFVVGFYGCTNAQKNANPAANGFNAAGSDPKAIALADAAMNAMGRTEKLGQYPLYYLEFLR